MSSSIQTSQTGRLSKPHLASERKDGVLKAQYSDVRASLTEARMGFDAFLEGNVATIMMLVSQTAQLRLTQAAYTRLGSPN
jgi:hypothetical protein